MSGNTEVREPFDAPVGKKERRKRDKVPKERVHIYLTKESLERVDEKADDLGLDRSPCIQVLINFALNKDGQPAPAEIAPPKAAGKTAKTAKTAVKRKKR